LGGWARRFPVPGGRRPAYRPAERLGVVGWAAVGVAFVAAGISTAVSSLLSEPARNGGGDADTTNVLRLFVDDVIVPALWEEAVWRLVVLGLLCR
jgi:hypothetical protein